MTDQQIGPYTIQHPLGSGGMADVYLAWDHANRWPVALKVMRGAAGKDARVVKRFEREAALLMKLRHPHIIQVYAAGQTADNRTFIAMEYVAGGDLHDLMHQKRGNKLPAAEAAYLMRRVAGAMAYAHEQGIVHRDLKPSNILLRADNGEPVVADLGIAAIAGGANSLTGTMESLGTPHYMAPEQAASGTVVDGRADIYAIGVMLFELLTGRQPFEADNGWALLFRKQQEAAPPVLTLRRDLDPRLAAVVDACLQRDPASRYQTAGALAAALDAFLPADARPPAPVKSRRATPTPRTPSGPPGNPPTPTPTPRNRRPMSLLWAGVAALALLALLVFFVPRLAGGGRVAEPSVVVVTATGEPAGEQATEVAGAGDETNAAAPTSTTAPTAESSIEEPKEEEPAATRTPTRSAATTRRSSTATRRPSSATTTTVRALRDVYTRSGPGLGYLTHGSLSRGEVVDVLGRNSRGDWFLVDASVGPAWVFEEYIVAVTGSLSAVAMAATIPATPTQPVATGTTQPTDTAQPAGGSQSTNTPQPPGTPQPTNPPQPPPPSRPTDTRRPTDTPWPTEPPLPTSTPTPDSYLPPTLERPPTDTPDPYYPYP